jgi:hypothetical protein
MVVIRYLASKMILTTFTKGKRPYCGRFQNLNMILSRKFYLSIFANKYLRAELAPGLTSQSREAEATS